MSTYKKRTEQMNEGQSKNHLKDNHNFEVFQERKQFRIKIKTFLMIKIDIIANPKPFRFYLEFL